MLSTFGLTSEFPLIITVVNYTQLPQKSIDLRCVTKSVQPAALAQVPHIEERFRLTNGGPSLIDSIQVN